jgi:hypothetical protein
MQDNPVCITAFVITPWFTERFLVHLVQLILISLLSDFSHHFYPSGSPAWLYFAEENVCDEYFILKEPEHSQV